MTWRDKIRLALADEQLRRDYRRGLGLGLALGLIAQCILCTLHRMLWR